MELTKHLNIWTRILKDYYSKNRVIWITQDAKSNYYATQKYNNGQDCTLSNKQYNSLMAMISPGKYYDPDYKNLPSDDKKDTALGKDRQTNYTNVEQVKNFLKGAIDSLFYYKLDFDDKVQVGQGCKIIKAYLTMQNEQGK